MKILIVGGKTTGDLGFKSLLRKVKKILSFFLFIFKFFTQNWTSLISTIFWYLVLLFRNQIKHVENVCFYWYLICKTRYSKMVKNKDMQFFMENLKMKRKRGKKIWPSLTGIWTPDFSTNSRPKFEIWGRLDLSSPGFLELLDFNWSWNLLRIL